MHSYANLNNKNEKKNAQIVLFPTIVQMESSTASFSIYCTRLLQVCAYKSQLQLLEQKHMQQVTLRVDYLLLVRKFVTFTCWFAW